MYTIFLLSFPGFFNNTFFNGFPVRITPTLLAKLKKDIKNISFDVYTKNGIQFGNIYKKCKQLIININKSYTKTHKNPYKTIN